MNILVTGGAGYIGSHMARMLAAGGHTPVVLDSMEYGNPQSLPKEITLIKGNVGDEAVVATFFKNHAIDAVIHFAGYISVAESVAHPIRYMDNNIIKPAVLLESMRTHGVTKLIFSSTAAVYGNPVTVPIPEDHPKNPVSPYGLSKWCFEELLRVYDRSYGIRSIALRYFNACGASQDGSYGEWHETETHLIPLAVHAALGNNPSFAVYGTDYPTPDGTALRDYIHVEDLCRAHMVVLDALQNGHASGVYNVGTGRGTSVREVVEEISRQTGVKVPVTQGPRRAGDPDKLIADPGRLMSEFGWKPEHSSIEEIVRTALAWHRSHPGGYAR